ncbi:MAG: anti-sigma factor antagonist [Candidatus Kapaibacterium sp.]|nr:MAG: anti-sigma factor antagonist [Candidatus Kapabacteria bacterium]
MSLIQTHAAANVLIVKVVPNRLDAKIAVNFKEEMTKLIQDGNHTIVLDLSGVDFIDSSGLGAIVTCLKVLGRKGDLVISGVKNDVMTMFVLTRMDRVFQLFPTIEAAAQSLAA